MAVGGPGGLRTGGPTPGVWHKGGKRVGRRHALAPGSKQPGSATAGPEPPSLQGAC